MSNLIVILFNLLDHELCHSNSKLISDEEDTLKSFMAFDITPRMPVFRMVVGSQIVVPPTQSFSSIFVGFYVRVMCESLVKNLWRSGFHNRLTTASQLLTRETSQVWNTWWNLKSPWQAGFRKWLSTWAKLRMTREIHCLIAFWVWLFPLFTNTI